MSGHQTGLISAPEMKTGGWVAGSADSVGGNRVGNVPEQ
jgi:hypothetical protein